MGRVNIREKDFLQAVRELAELLGWAVYHTWNSIHSPAGFPDLVLVRPPRVVFAELKVGRRKPTPAQQQWLERLARCRGVETHIWTDQDWDDIVRVLSRNERRGLTDISGKEAEDDTRACYREGEGRSPRTG